MRERYSYVDRHPNRAILFGFTSIIALIAGVTLGAGGDSKPKIVVSAASAPEKKKPSCSMTQPHFDEASRSNIVDDHDYVIDAVRMRDCLGTVVFCFQDVVDYPQPLNCNWGDYNRRAQKKFKEANRPR